MVRAPASAWNCLGRASVESGHSRVPEPPDMITGTISTAADGPAMASPSLPPGVMAKARAAIKRRALRRFATYSRPARSQPRPAPSAARIRATVTVVDLPADRRARTPRPPAAGPPSAPTTLSSV